MVDSGVPATCGVGPMPVVEREAGSEIARKGSCSGLPKGLFADEVAAGPPAVAVRSPMTVTVADFASALVIEPPATGRARCADCAPPVVALRLSYNQGWNIRQCGGID
jgi:hypothetical protein